MNELLQRWMELDLQIQDLQTEMAEVEEALHRQVALNDNRPMVDNALGLRVEYKPGRRSTDHQAAATHFDVDDDLVQQYTTVKTTKTIAWAKVTKAAKIPKASLAEFTSVGDGTYVIRPL